MSGMESAAALAALREAGAAQMDAVQLHYLETLHQRLQTQPPAIQRLLQDRLARALADMQARLASARQEAHAALERCVRHHPQAAPQLQCLLDAGDFKQLVRSVAALDAPQQESPWAALLRTAARPERKAVQQFRSTWSGLRARQQVQQALAQAPQNAGPINSHMLVLRSLALMRDLSPSYLSHFMAYADSLLCLQQLDADRLESARATASAVGGKKPRARRVRPKKSAG